MRERCSVEDRGCFVGVAVIRFSLISRGFCKTFLDWLKPNKRSKPLPLVRLSAV